MKLYVRPVDLELHFCNALLNAKCPIYEMCILMSWINFVFMTFVSETTKGPVKVTFQKHPRFDLVNLDQTRHLMTSNEKVLNTEKLELMKLYLSYIVHFCI